ncbi:retrovirus-related pol polyprotein from transposon TNT 1-94 [Tanacetum coccineum]
MKEKVSILKKDFKQKEDKHLEEFLDMKKLKEKVEDRLYKQDQSVQTRNLTPEQIFWSKEEKEIKKTETSVPKPPSALTVYSTNTPAKLVPRVLPTKSQVKINLYTLTQLFTEFEKTCKKKITPTGLTDGERVSNKLKAEVDQNAVDKQCAKIVKKILLIENENLIVNCLSNQLLHAVEQSHCLDLEAEISKLQHESQKDIHNKMIKHVSKLEREYLNLQLKYQHLQERRSEADSANDVKALGSHNLEVTENVTALLEQNKNFRAENEKVKQHYKELYDSIMITRETTNEKTSSLLTEIVNLKDQLRGKMSCVTMDSVKPKVLAPGMYAIDVEPIPLSLKNNRNAHLDYLNHLKESVEIVHEIAEEARAVKPLDNVFASACFYTKRSQELLEYVFGTCPKDFNKRDNMSNVHAIPSTGVSNSIEASGSKPKSNTKKNRILPAKSENKKKVEDHPRKNKYRWTRVNRVDSSISSKRVVTNSNSESCAKRKLFAIVGSQWRPTCKKFASVGYQWRPTRKKLIVGEQCSLIKPTNPKVVPLQLNVALVKCCSKHMTGNHSRLKNYVKKFIGTVRFKNDHFGAIMGYGDYVIGDSVISRNMDGVDLLKGCRNTNLYTISVDEMLRSSPICLLSKASKNKSWLWHRRLNHLNFDKINDLTRKDPVQGLPRLKFKKDHLCSAFHLRKSKKYTHKPKSKIMEVLHTLHMDLCGPMIVQSINGKKYMLVIVDDYSRFTWEFVIKFIKQIQVGLNKTVRYIRTDNGTKFFNQTLTEYYESIEAARTMLIFSKAPMFLWAEAVTTACYTKNKSLIHTRHNKTPYELVHDKKPDLVFLRVFGALCYPTNDSEDLGKLQAKADIGLFVGYAPSRKGYRVYNKRTYQIMETIHVQFDELIDQMAPVHISSGPEPIMMTLGQLNSGLTPS